MNAGDKKALHVSILKNFSQIHFVCVCEILKCGYVCGKQCVNVNSILAL